MLRNMYVVSMACRRFPFEHRPLHTIIDEKCNSESKHFPDFHWAAMKFRQKTGSLLAPRWEGFLRHEIAHSRYFWPKGRNSQGFVKRMPTPPLSAISTGEALFPAPTLMANPWK